MENLHTFIKEQNMVKDCFFNDKCNEMLAKFSTAGVDTPHIIIAQPENAGVLIELFIEKLALAHYKKISSSVRRPFENCLLELKYKGEDFISTDEHKQFLESPRNKANNYNNFKGVWVIEISDYIKNFNSPAFTNLMNHVSSNTEYIRYIFCVKTNSNDTANNLFRILKKYVRRIELVNMEYLDTHHYVSFASELLLIKGFKLSEGFNEVLFEYINEMLMKKSFSGFDSIYYLIEDITYASHGVITNNEITEKHFLDIKEKLFINSEYDNDIPSLQIGFAR